MIRFVGVSRSQRLAVGPLLTVLLTALLTVVLTAAAGLSGWAGGSAAARPLAQSGTQHGTQTLASAFVTRSGGTLLLGGQPFRFSGANLYWTGLDENVSGVDPRAGQAVGYPTAFRIRDGLRAAQSLGAAVVRAHTVGISTGNPLSLEPTLAATNAAAWGPIDLTVAEASRLGLRLVVPLTDNWQYYHGGRYDILRWLGLSTGDNGSAFYTDQRAVAAYQDYVRTVVDHVNPLTGRRLGDDPTILAWELGNELDYATAGWVQQNALFVKSLAPQQLVMAGRSWRVDPAVLAAPAVDISDSHYYPLDVAAVHDDAAAVTRAGKAFMVGEYPSTDATDTALQSLAGDRNVSGAAVWSLFPHADHYGFVQHDDGYTLHVPGDEAAMVARVSAIRRFGTAIGTVGMPRVTARPPLLTSVSPPSNGARTVRWRGTADAATYFVRASVSGRTVATSPTLGGDVTSWTVPVAGPVTVTVSGASSGGAGVGSTSLTAGYGAAVVDPLEDWYVSAAQSPGLVRSSTATGVQVAPVCGREAWMAWSGSAVPSGTPGAAVASVSAALAGSGALPVVEAQASGGAWTPASATTRQQADGSRTISAAGLAAAAVRIHWPAGACAALTAVTVTTTS